MSRYRTRWTAPEEHRESAEYTEAGQRMALAEAVYNRRTALGWTAPTTWPRPPPAPPCYCT